MSRRLLPLVANLYCHIATSSNLNSCLLVEIGIEAWQLRKQTVMDSLFKCFASRHCGKTTSSNLLVFVLERILGMELLPSSILCSHAAASPASWNNSPSVLPLS